MNDPRREDDSQIGLLDRLAAGDLDHAARRELFVWLDREPARWRRCALALLEARELEQALGDWTAESSSEFIPRREGSSEFIPRPRRGHPGPDAVSRPAADATLTTLDPALPLIQARRRRAQLFALAASVLIAFGLGIAVRGIGIEPPPAIVQAPVQSGNANPPAEPRRADRAPAASTGGNGSQPHDPTDATLTAADRWPSESAGPIPAYVRSQLERRGYRVDSRHRVIPVSLPDGRRAMLPVDQLQVRYVGQRAY